MVGAYHLRAWLRFLIRIAWQRWHCSIFSRFDERDSQPRTKQIQGPRDGIAALMPIHSIAQQKWLTTSRAGNARHE